MRWLVTGSINLLETGLTEFLNTNNAVAEAFRTLHRMLNKTKRVGTIRRKSRSSSCEKSTGGNGMMEPEDEVEILLVAGQPPRM